jgi:hypothetical protein
LQIESHGIFFWECRRSDERAVIDSSAVKRVEFVNDRMSYIILRGGWFHIIVLNFHAPAEDTTHDMKVRFYEDLKVVFDRSLNTVVTSMPK